MTKQPALVKGRLSVFQKRMNCAVCLQSSAEKRSVKPAHRSTAHRRRRDVALRPQRSRAGEEGRLGEILAASSSGGGATLGAFSGPWFSLQRLVDPIRHPSWHGRDAGRCDQSHALFKKRHEELLP